ncbi:phage major tail protein, TP901-1 family [Enterococcus sp. AZ136]|uniref:phage major tail protein, TP901-1 family n=1 Tax=Enterococcus sp. AZ136 TaxID=2774788 RepID=UPI003D286970
MTRKISGAEVLLKIKEGSTLVTVAGQQGMTLNLSGDTIDTTDKTSGGWKTAMAGLLEWGIDQDVFYTVGDKSNELLLNAFVNRKPVTVEVMVGGTDEAGSIKYSGEAYITSFPMDFALDNAVSVSMSLAGASALEIDIKSAVAPQSATVAAKSK